MILDFQKFEDDPQATKWKPVRDGAWSLDGAQSLNVSGRLIGGCIETVCNLAGTRYGDVADFGRQHADEGLIVCLEAAGDEAATICRNLHGLRYALCLKCRGMCALVTLPGTGGWELERSHVMLNPS